MKKLFIALFLLFCGFSSFSQTTPKPQQLVPLFSLELQSGYSFASNPNYLYIDSAIAGGVNVLARASLRMPFWNPLFFGLEADFGYNPILVDAAALSADLYRISGGAQAGFILDLPLGISLRGYALGGGTYARLSAGLDSQEGLLYFGGGAQLSLKLTQSLTASLDAAWLKYSALMEEARFGAGVIWNIAYMTPAHPLRIEAVTINPVFPVLYKYYDANPFGRLRLVNDSLTTLNNVKVSFFMKQYMDNPQVCPTPQTIKPGETVEVPVLALFTPSVLTVAESVKAQCVVRVEFSAGGKTFAVESEQSARLYDANATMWDDDRKVAAFVTTLDKTVQAFYSNAVGAAGKMPPMLNAQLCRAAAVFQALGAYGMAYAPDPQTPYTQFSKDRAAVDYLRFPRQTLMNHGGDCDDLSILFNALLESGGIETAFITVPGHIYAAFSPGMTAEEAQRSFFNVEDLIFAKDRVWVPIETTMIGSGIQKAWKEGARQWRENGTAASLIPVRDSWSVFEPVGIAADSPSLQLPSQAQLSGQIAKVLSGFAQLQMAPEEKRLQAEIFASRDTSKNMNRLGILYAKYGFTEKAKAEFEAVLTQGDYLPTLVNMGNLSFTAGDMASALKFYSRAYARDTQNAAALLGYARTQQELGNGDIARSLFEELSRVDPSLAQQYSPSAQGAGGARAASVERQEVEWSE